MATKGKIDTQALDGLESKVDNLATILDDRLDREHADNREILKVLAQRDETIGAALKELLEALKGQTEAFRDQAEKVKELLDLRTRFRELADDLEAERRRNDKLHAQIGLIWKLAGPVVGAVSIALAFIVLNLN